MKPGNPRVSIVVPCYNHGKYVPEIIQGIEAIGEKSLYEVIIVNDGSTDGITETILKDFDKAKPENYTVIFQENQGVCATRNNAIRMARGEFILPVDADNRVYPEYIYKALEIFETNPEISIVYSDAKLTGHESGVRYQMDFNLHALMTYNYIDTCAIYRKTVWEALGGYDANMIWGFEDWEFWLHAAFKGFKFHHINEELFEYRVEDNARTKNLLSSESNVNALMNYMMNKHSQYYGPNYATQYMLNRLKFAPLYFIRKLLLQAYFPRLFNKLVQRGKMRWYL